MPNWVRTRLTFVDISDEKFEEIIQKYTVEDEHSHRRVFDFEKVIPMPNGTEDWYHWRLDNWWTKWNARDGKVDNQTHSIEFETAWSFVFPVVKKLSEILECSIIAIYADENFGYNVDKIIFVPSGKFYDFDVVDDSDEAWGIVKELWELSDEDIDEWR